MHLATRNRRTLIVILERPPAPVCNNSGGVPVIIPQKALTHANPANPFALGNNPPRITKSSHIRLKPALLYIRRKAPSRTPNPEAPNSLRQAGRRSGVCHGTCEFSTHRGLREAAGLRVFTDLSFTHRPLSSSFLWYIFRIL